MGTFPSAALQLRPIEQPDLLGNFAKLAQIRSLQQQQQLQQLQMQEAEQTIQKNQFAIRDKDIVTKAYVRNNGDLDKTIMDAAKEGATPDTIQQLQLHKLDVDQKNLALFKAKGENALIEANLMKGAHDTVDKADPKNRPALYQMQRTALANAGIDVSQLPPEYPGDEQFKLIGVGVQGHTQQMEELAKQVEIRKSTAEAGLKEQEGQFYKGTGGALAPGVTPEASAFMDYMKTPGARPDQYPAYKAKSEAAATLPYKVATARAEGEARADIQAKIARGSNAALAEVPPHLVAPASAAANKAGEDYAQAQSVTQRLNAMMDAARRGNVVSYQVLPEEGTLQITTSQGVHRINQAEIQQYAGGGSLWQRMMGHVGKTLTGESIPKSVLDDMAEIQKIQSQGSQLKYNNSLKTINQTYGAKFQPVEMDTMKSAQGGGPPSGATHIAPGSDGRNHYTNDKGEDLGIAP